ncbi:hypothetical protein GCM10011609_39280 [Lentzea pudingi]|uniref:Uncharacterized protein n=2 Tax=Lentzea pudingi TaxID=1789439 RepID=A0ABQ2I3E4_9PSEU|nr:hypothetical protein GCM10011609_39280 [Lentzea pudingi]
MRGDRGGGRLDVFESHQAHVSMMHVTGAQPVNCAQRPTCVMSEKEKITPVKLIASVLAAATAAVLSLRLNLVGTIVGAVLASVVTTLGAVFYQRSMEREKRWQVIAVGGVLVFVVTVLTMTSVQLVTGRPVTADPGAPSTSTRTETHTETTKTETETVTVPPSSTPQSSDSTTTTAPSSTTESRQPTDSSTPSSTPDPIR